MKRLVSATMFATCLLVASATVRAQDCSNWSNWDVRGTYTASGSGWTDLSKLLPGAPAGFSPVSWVGAVALNGVGGGTGWVSGNEAGTPVNIQLLNLTYSVQTDCSVQMSFSMKIKELGVTVGPVSRLMVIFGGGEALEVRGMWKGAGPGTEVDSFVARRISMRF